MKPTAFAERMGRLVDKFANLKLRVKLHAKIGEELRVEMEEEDLVLTPELQDKAFDIAAKEVSDRMATMFVKELAKQIRAIIEQDGDDEEAGGKDGEQAKDEERAAQARRRRRRREAEERLGRAGGARSHGVDDDGRDVDHNHDGENRGDGRGGGESSADQNAQEEEPFPRNAKQIHQHLESFLHNNLSLFNIDDDMVKRLSIKVETEGRRIQRELDLSEEEVMWLATISLYDIVILCDDSGSMKQGKRIPALLNTLQSVTAWATRLEPSGVSVRFLNFAGDTNEEYDNITSGDKLADIVYKVGRKLGNKTKLGTALEEKVLRHRVEKVDRPLIAVIITDGDPIGEIKTRLRDCIISYKNRLGETGSKAGLVFIIFQVGKNKQAQEFLNSLSEDPEMEGLMHRSNQPVDDVMERLEGRLDVVESDVGRDYKRYLLQEFIGAMMGQTEDS